MRKPSGNHRKSINLVIALAVALIGIPGVACAQSTIQPPSVTALDQNSVNLATGKFNPPSADIAIGGAGSSLSHVTNGGADNFNDSLKMYYSPPPANLGLGGPIVVDASLDLAVYHFIVGGGIAFSTSSMTTGPWFDLKGKAKLECTGVPSEHFNNGVCTLTVADGTQATYLNNADSGSATGKLQSIVRANGEVLTPTYSSSTGRLNAISSSLGWMLKYDYSGLNATFTLLNSSQVYCDPSASVCTAASGFPTVFRDGTSGTLTQNGILLSTSTLSGNTITLTSSSGLTKTIVYSGSDTSGRVASVSVGGSTWTYSYIDSTMTSPISGGFGNYVYPTLATTVTAPNGSTRTLVTNSVGIVSQKDEAGRITTYVYDSANPVYPGKIIKIINPDATYSGTTLTGGYVEYEYSGWGNITKATSVPRDAGADTSKYIISSATYATCDNDNYRWCNKPLTTTDANGITTTYSYHGESGNLATVTLPPPASGGVSPQTRYEYVKVIPHVRNASGALDPAPAIWRLASTSTCMNPDHLFGQQ